MPSPAAAPAPRAAVAAGLSDLDDSDEETETLEEAPPEASNEDSPTSAAGCIPIPNLNGGAGDVGEDGYAAPRRKRQGTELAGSAAPMEAANTRKPLGALEDSRRQFQRLWTDEDEIVILQGFLDFTARRGAAHHLGTGPFYEEIRARLQLDFNKSQLVEKLRRLKKKFRNAATRMTTGKEFAFRSPHDQAAFELSRQIWGRSSVYSRGAAGEDYDDVDLTSHRSVDHEGSVVQAVAEGRRKRIRKRSVSIGDAAANAAAEALVLTAEAPVEVKVGESHTPTTTAPVPVPRVVEETVRNCLSPMFKELLCCAVGGQIGAGNDGLDGLRLSLLPLGAGGSQIQQMELKNVSVADDRWRKQQILELEVFSKRMELLQEQIKRMLRELRSAG